MDRTDTDPSPRSPTAGGTPDICVVLNKSSGAGKDEAFHQRLDAALARHPGRFAVERLDAGEDLDKSIRRVAGGGYRVVVAAGGDGTITAVAEALAGSEVALGILPLGTFNFVARGLEIPEDVEAAVDLVATGTARSLSVAEVNGRLFLNNASLGLYPAILREREGIYRRWGRSRLAAYWSVIRTVMGLLRPLTLRVSVDGKQLRTRTPLMFVARSAYQLEHYGLDGAEAVRQDRFAVLLAPDVGRLGLLRLALRLAVRGLDDGRDMEIVVGEDIIVETDRSRPIVARDGERARLTSPLHFRIRKDALTVIAPSPAS
jgi:diacylglycerol kinase family enzyme